MKYNQNTDDESSLSEVSINSNESAKNITFIRNEEKYKTKIFYPASSNIRNSISVQRNSILAPTEEYNISLNAKSIQAKEFLAPKVTRDMIKKKSFINFKNNPTIEEEPNVTYKFIRIRYIFFIRKMINLQEK